MVQTAGRPISTALRLLLGQTRLLASPRAQRFAALLEDSRKFQNEVSERLAEQVLHALYELVRGLQAADDRAKGELLREPLNEHPDEVYRALLTVILRLVFLLYAEERDMLPEDETFLRYYSLTDPRNLPMIRAHGLLSRARLGDMGIETPAPGGNQWSHDADDQPCRVLDPYPDQRFSASRP